MTSGMRGSTAQQLADSSTAQHLGKRSMLIPAQVGGLQLWSASVACSAAVQDAFLLADDVLRQGVQGVSDIITTPGLINVDFADIRAVMYNSGTAMLGVGRATGPNRAEDAARAATAAPLIQCSIERATGALV